MSGIVMIDGSPAELIPGHSIRGERIEKYYSEFRLNGESAKVSALIVVVAVASLVAPSIAPAFIPGLVEVMSH